MTSFTGCLGFGEEEPDELITPIDAYEPPQASTIMVDSGYTGYWDCDDESDGSGSNCEYIPCTKHGYQEFHNDGNANDYCDIDGHTNYGPQTIVKKIGNQVSIECIKDWEGISCKNYNSAYVLFTSIEGLQEMIYCSMSEQYYDDQNDNYEWKYHKCEATLGFEPVSFEITHSHEYLSDTNSNYYYYVSFRVF